MQGHGDLVVKLAEFCITVYCVEWFPEMCPHPPLHDGSWHLYPSWVLKISERAVSSSQSTAEEAYDSKLLYPPEHQRYKTCLHSPMKLLPAYVHILALCVHSSKLPASGSLNLDVIEVASTTAGNKLHVMVKATNLLYKTSNYLCIDLEQRGTEILYERLTIH